MLCFLLEGQKFLERYEHDPHYKLLYDSVCDFFVENLKSDIEKLKRQKLKHPDIYPGMDNLFGRSISMAGYSYFDYPNMCPISMFRSIAVKLFPRESDPEFQGLEEADYKGRVWSQLFEVLAPLAHACGTQYEYRDPIEPPAHKTYLERLKAEKSKLRADALLPHQIIAYVHHWDFGKVAELQWNAMVEDIKKQGNNMILNNCFWFYAAVSTRNSCVRTLWKCRLLWDSWFLN
ncbi:unnamed protein product [Prunus armeniaca]|uniref:DUF2828 domain-containing protein n=1 Tax=Prunus armeniaca TaxID=36596 RepID=A0A6J5WEE5_PRUAR|nr:unnamed protein product [Prunus armeniaca]